MKKILLVSLLLSFSYVAYAKDKETNEEQTNHLPQLSAEHLHSEIKRLKEEIKKLTELANNTYVLEVNSDMQGTSVPLDETAFSNLCGDDDGCLITLGMKNWIDNRPDNIATLGPYELFYSFDTKWWRRSEYHNGRTGIVNAAEGRDGDAVVQHALVGWDKCYLTDGVYKDYQSEDSDASGFSLLLWRNTTYSSPKTSCRITIRD